MFTRQTRRCEWSNRNLDPRLGESNRRWASALITKRRCAMNKLVTAVALATLIASPAFAQSFDPHLGSGNIVRPIPGATGTLARRHAPQNLRGLCFDAAGGKAVGAGERAIRAGQAAPSSLLMSSCSTRPAERPSPLAGRVDVTFLPIPTELTFCGRPWLDARWIFHRS
jgi:hypothetical protein